MITLREFYANIYGHAILYFNNKCVFILFFSIFLRCTQMIFFKYFFSQHWWMYLRTQSQLTEIVGSSMSTVYISFRVCRYASVIHQSVRFGIILFSFFTDAFICIRKITQVTRLVWLRTLRENRCTPSVLFNDTCRFFFQQSFAKCTNTRIIIYTLRHRNWNVNWTMFGKV